MIDLFAGCGGMTVGLRRRRLRAGARGRVGPLAAATYAANFGEDHIDRRGHRRGPGEQIPAADVVIGGPPCQGFSNLGLKALDDPRNQLWREYMRFIRTAKPQVFVIENVDRFPKSPEFQMLLDEVDHGLLKDYEISHRVLNAADYGVAQRRRRTIVIGSRVGPDRPARADARQGPGAERAAAVADRPRRHRGSAGSTGLDRTPGLRDRVLRRADAGRLQGPRHPLPSEPEQLSLERYSFVPPGGGRFDVPTDLLPRCWREKPTGTTDVMGRMRWDCPSLTIRTEFFKPEKGAYLHPQWVPGRAAPRRRPALDQG